MKIVINHAQNAENKHETSMEPLQKEAPCYHSLQWLKRTLFLRISRLGNRFSVHLLDGENTVSLTYYIMCETLV